MEDEMKSLTENDTFTVVRLPDDRKSVGGRWVYSVKLDPDATEKYKARYVAKGYSQVERVDYLPRDICAHCSYYFSSGTDAGCSSA